MVILMNKHKRKDTATIHVFSFSGLPPVFPYALTTLHQHPQTPYHTGIFHMLRRLPHPEFPHHPDVRPSSACSSDIPCPVSDIFCPHIWPYTISVYLSFMSYPNIHPYIVLLCHTRMITWFFCLLLLCYTVFPVRINTRHTVAFYALMSAPYMPPICHTRFIVFVLIPDAICIPV